MTEERPVLIGLNLVTADMAKTIEFYRRLGLEIDDGNPWGNHHVTVTMPNGFELEFDSLELAESYDPGGGAPAASPVRNVMVFNVPSRSDVDELYQEMLDAGYDGHQPPYDAFWGARYAVVDDPSGNYVGLMSPSDDDFKSDPPAL